MIIGENITKKYGKNTVLSNFSFTVDDGEKAVLAGRSGAGKTTLLRLICSLEKADSGRLYGYDKKDIAYMFQEHRLLPWASVVDNVLAPVEASDSREAKKLLEVLELGNDLDKMPDELSGGMKQRVALARALIYDKPILILDEPFVALDETVKKKAAELIKEKTADKTVILVSHNTDDYKLVFDSFKSLMID